MVAPLNPSSDVIIVQVIFTLLVILCIGIVISIAIRLLRQLTPKNIVISAILISCNLLLIGALLPTVDVFVRGSSTLTIQGDTGEIWLASTSSRSEFLNGINKISVGRFNDLAYIGEQLRLVWMDEGELPTGVYMPTERSIYFRGPEVDSFTFAHELHHDIWHWRLTDQEREEWKTIHYAQDVRPPTPYARTDLTEDFAESGALYTHAQERLDQRRVDFFNKIYRRILECDEILCCGTIVC